MKKEIVEFMQRENVAQEEWEEMVRSLEKLKIQKEEERKQKEEERKQKEEERKQKEEERKQKEEALSQIRKSISLLMELGLSKEEIAIKLNIPLSQI
jgi:chromatin assembly factor 1 subunit A